MLLVAAVKTSPFFLFFEKLLAKRIISSATSPEIKLGKSDDEISSNVFTVISLIVPLI